MGSGIEIAGQRLYLDTNVFIYALESIEPWSQIAQRILSSVDEGKSSAVTSELTLAECLIKPLVLNQEKNISLYQTILQSKPNFEIIPISRKVLLRAAEFRARTNMKMPDAIHCATASVMGVHIFVSNDSNLKPIDGVKNVSFHDLSLI